MKLLVPVADSPFVGQEVVDSIWIGPRLRQIRIAAGFETQAALGARVGVRQGTVGKWEAERERPDADEDEPGTRGQEPKYSAIMFLCEILGVSPAEFSKPVGTPIEWLPGRAPNSKKKPASN